MANISAEEAKAGFTATTDFLTDFPGYKSFEVGGESRRVFWHVPEYAAVQICATAKNDAGEPLTPPRCDPLQPTEYVVLLHDLGSVRLPVVGYFFMSLILFALSLSHLLNDAIQALIATMTVSARSAACGVLTTTSFPPSI